jgi:antitoxin PrlF
VEEIVAIYKAKLTSKGQITLPAGVRTRLGLKPGEKLAFFEGASGEFTLRRVGSIQEMEGCLKGLDLPKTDEEMNRQIAAYLRGLDDATKSGAEARQDGDAA